MMVIAIVLVGVVPATALTLYTIKGRVFDKAGSPLAQVTVTDGSQIVTTDSTGYYEIHIPPTLLPSRRVTVSRTGLESQSRLVNPAEALLGSIDFHLRYVAGVRVSPATFQNTSPTTLDITFTSYAPSNSCVLWTDTTTGRTEQLVLQTEVTGGNSAWVGHFAVPTETQEGTYSYNAVAKTPDCTTDLSRVAIGTYVVSS